MNIYIIWFLIIIFFAILILIKFTKTKKISNNNKIFFKNQLKIIKNSSSYKSMIIDLDKLYHKILISYGYNWSFWSILKSKPKIIPNLNKIWDLHKLRNKLVHDFNNPSESMLKWQSNTYIIEINKLIK
jgi:hypothetical protein